MNEALTRHQWNRPGATLEPTTNGGTELPRREISKRGKELLRKSLSDVHLAVEAEKQEIARLEGVPDEVSSDDDDDEEEDVSGPSSGAKPTSSSASASAPSSSSGRMRRRSTYLGGKQVQPQRPPPFLVHDAFIVPPPPETFEKQGFADLAWYRGAGKSSREQGFYSGQALSPVVRMLNVTRTLKPVSFQLFPAAAADPHAELVATRVITPKAFRLSAEGQIAYTLRRKGKSKIYVFEGDTEKDTSMLRYVCQFGADRVCIKRRDESSLGIALGATLVDWRPDPNPAALLDKVRIGSGFDVFLAMACFGLADYAHGEYKFIAATSAVKKLVEQATSDATSPRSGGFEAEKARVAELLSRGV